MIKSSSRPHQRKRTQGSAAKCRAAVELPELRRKHSGWARAPGPATLKQPTSARRPLEGHRPLTVGTRYLGRAQVPEVSRFDLTVLALFGQQPGSPKAVSAADILDETTAVPVDLYGSLAAMGLGHGTRTAIALGLEGAGRRRRSRSNPDSLPLQLCGRTAGTLHFNGCPNQRDHADQRAHVSASSSNPLRPAQHPRRLEDCIRMSVTREGVLPGGTTRK